MARSHIENRTNINLLAIALRGENDAIVLFECFLPAESSKRVFVWATCGQRRRKPVPAHIVSDVFVDEARRLAVSVEIPFDYTACTLHVHARLGFTPLHVSRHVTNEEYCSLASKRHCAETDPRYDAWFRMHRADEAELARQRTASKNFSCRPLISIVTPVFCTPKPFLEEYLHSLLSQTYDHFELVIVNVSGPCEEVEDVLGACADERVRVIEAPNLSISENTNVGIAAARGDYIGFVDHDDFIEPDALFRYVEVLNKHPECDLLFCDEDLWYSNSEKGSFCGARFKPGWSASLACSYNYVCHLLMVSRWALDRTERSDADVDGAQDFDLTLKVSEVAREICAVPSVLYHWRCHDQSTSLNRKSKPYALEAGRIAVQRHFDRVGVSVEVEVAKTPFSYRVRYRCYENSKITLVLVGSRAGMTAEPAGTASAFGGDIELIACGIDALNQAVHLARGERIVVLGHSVDVRSAEWLHDIVDMLDCPDVACVAPLIIDRDTLVQSCGLVHCAEGSWKHCFAGSVLGDPGYLLLLEHVHDVSAVSSCCFAFRKADFERLGGLDETLPLDWAVVDWCLRLREEGLATVVSPYIPVLIDGLLEDLRDEELARELEERHPLLGKGDLFRNVLLNQNSNDCELDLSSGGSSLQ